MSKTESEDEADITEDPDSQVDDDEMTPGEAGFAKGAEIEDDEESEEEEESTDDEVK